MNEQENEAFKELKKELTSLNAMVHRREIKIEDMKRNEDYLKSVITDLETKVINLESKCIVLQHKSIDREILT